MGTEKVMMVELIRQIFIFLMQMETLELLKKKFFLLTVSACMRACVRLLFRYYLTIPASKHQFLSHDKNVFCAQIMHVLVHPLS